MVGRGIHIVTLMVDNEFGVLTRITALIRRAGWNIRSLAVAETAVPEVSRLTVCLECRHHSFETVLERLEQQSCVQAVTRYDPDTQIARELAILRFGPLDEAQVARLQADYHAQIMEHTAEGALFTVACREQELDTWLPELQALGLQDIARTGTVALKRGLRDG